MPSASPLPTSLKADRRLKLCDEEGILPAISKAMKAGRLPGFDTPEGYLEAVLEGKVPDGITSFGWALCGSPATCTRLDRCRRKQG